MRCRELMIKLIVLDMDGIFLDVKMSIINDNVLVICEVECLGIEFMVVIGCVYIEVKFVLEEVGIDCVMIILNGV